MTGTQVSACSVPAGVPRIGAQDLYRRARETQERSRALVEEARRICRELERANASDSRKQLLERSAYARLLARVETMPVIEQAKGILMVQSGCGAAEAFDILRRASQRSNVPVRDLAARIVATTARMPAPEPSQGNSTTVPRRQPAGLSRAS